MEKTLIMIVPRWLRVSLPASVISPILTCPFSLSLPATSSMSIPIDTEAIGIDGKTRPSHWAAWADQSLSTTQNQDLSTASNRSNAFWLGLGLRIFWVICTKMKTHSLLRCYIVPRVSKFYPKQIQSHLWRWSRRAGAKTLALGRLSDLIENNKRLEDHFNNNQREQLSGIYNMLISMTNDVRVVLIKLAERTLRCESCRMPVLSVSNGRREVMTITRR